jgi:RNA polymerase sigma-70 factor (ECF subfamily)
MKPLRNLSDQELIREYQNNNLEALNCLIKRYKDRVYTAVYLMVKDKQLAEDIFQEAFIRAIKSLKENSYKEKGMFLAWILRITHNIYLDYLRKAKRTAGRHYVESYTIVDELSASEEEAGHHMLHEQKLEHITRMIFLLPEEQQEIIILRHFAELSFKEIAAILHISINTALGRTRYALMNLRRILKTNQITF